MGVVFLAVTGVMVTLVAGRKPDEEPSEARCAGFGLGRPVMVFMVLWVGHMFYLRRKRTVDFSKVGLYLGLFMTAVLGALARWVYWFAK